MGTKKLPPKKTMIDDQTQKVGAFDIIESENKKNKHLQYQISFDSLLDSLNKYCGRYLKLNIYSKIFILNKNQFVLEHVVQRRKRNSSSQKLSAMAYMSYKISLNVNADFLDIIVDDLVIIGDIKQENYKKIIQFVNSIELFKIINLQSNINILPKKNTFYHSLNLKNFITSHLKNNDFEEGFKANHMNIAIEDGSINLEIHESRKTQKQNLGYSDINFDLRSIEIQEYSEAFSKIDNLFQTHKVTECSQEIFKSLLKHTNNRLILSYLSMVMIFQKTDQQHLNLLISGINHFPTENILLSALLKHYFNTKRPSQIIDTLEKITFNITNIDPKTPSLIASFLPEVLGDLWEKIDFDQARICYKKALQVEPGHPRILTKLIELAEKQQKHNEQLNYLKQMINIERRQPHLADQLMKASKIYHRQNQPAQAIEYAAKGFKLSPNSMKAATLLSDLYNETKQYEKSVVVIDMFIKNNKQNLSRSDHSKLQLALARIWLNHLSRPDIAIIHLDRSINLNEKNSESMMLLASIYREQGNYTELVKALNIQLQNYRKQKRDNEATSIIQELASIYKNHLDQSDDAWVLYKAALLGERIDAEVFTKYLTNDTDGVDWNDVEKKLKSQLINDKEKKQKFETLTLLYKVQLNHTQDIDEAYTTLLKASEFGTIEKHAFNQLCNHLIKNKKFKKTHEILKERIEHVTSFEKTHLIEKIIKLPFSPNLHEKDEYIVRLLKSDNSKDYPLFDRLTEYAKNNDEDNFENLLKQVKRIQTDNTKIHSWLNATNQIIFEHQFSSKFRMLEKNFQFMWTLTDDKTSLAKIAVNFLSNSDDLNQLRKYVIYLLEAKITPSLEQDKIEQIIGPDPDLKFTYLYPLCFHEDKNRVKNIRKTVKLLSMLQDKKPEIKISLLYELSKETQLSKEEFDILNRYMEKHHKWNEVSQLLHNQINNSQSDSNKLLLQSKLALLLAQKFNRFESSYKIMKEAFEDHNNTNKQECIDTTLELIDKHPDNTHKKLLLSLIWNHYEHMKQSQDIRKFFQIASTEKISLPGLVEKLSKNKDQATVYSTMKDVWNEGYQDFNTAKFILEKAINQKLKPDVIFYWLRSVELIQNQFSLEEHIRETIEKIKDYDTVDEIDLFDSFLSHPNSIDSQSIIEILLPIALKNFRAEKEPIRTYRYFQKVLELDAYNTEAIIPYYFLLLDYGTIENKISFSKDLMALLTKNPDLLNDYPLTIESIDRKYKKLINIMNAQKSTANTHNEQNKAHNTQKLSKSTHLTNHNTEITNVEIDNNKTIIAPKLELELTEITTDKNQKQENLQIELPPVPTSAKVENLVSNWRESIENDHIDSNDIENILDNLNKTTIQEQSLGIQVISLLSGKPELLDKCPLQPWTKKINNEFHNTTKKRKSLNLPVKYTITAFVKLIQNLSKMISDIFDSKFSRKFVLRTLNMNVDLLNKKSDFLSVDNQKIQPLNLHFYADDFKNAQLKLCNVKGINHQITFEQTTKTIYFDLDYHYEKDIKKLSYQILYLYFLSKNKLYIIMNLNFDPDLKGFITALRTYVKEGKIINVKDRNKLKTAFSAFSRQKLDPYIPVLTSINRQTYAEIKNSINQSIYQEMLLDNLDLLSIIKLILNVDPLANLQVFRNVIQDEQVMELIKYATELKLD